MFKLKSVSNKEFLKQKYKYNLVSHNLDNDNSIVIDGVDYVVVKGKDNNPLWVWGCDNLSEEKFLELFEILLNFNKNDIINLCCNKIVCNYLDKFGYDLSNTSTYVCYKCDELIVPKIVDGCMVKSTLIDKEFIARNWLENSRSFGYDNPYEVCLKMAQKWIDSNKIV